MDRRVGVSGQHLCLNATLGSRRQRGAKAQAIDPSRGGQTTKIHLLADVLGRPAVIHLTPGNASDVRTAPEVLAKAPGRRKRLVADRGFDANHLRHDLRSAGTTPVIPGTRSRKRPIRHDAVVIGTAGRSRRPSAGSRTSGGSPPATTSSPTTTCQPSHSSQPSASGADCVWILGAPEPVGSPSARKLEWNGLGRPEREGASAGLWRAARTMVSRRLLYICAHLARLPRLTTPWLTSPTLRSQASATIPPWACCR
jgi:transposase